MFRTRRKFVVEGLGLTLATPFFTGGVSLEEFLQDLASEGRSISLFTPFNSNFETNQVSAASKNILSVLNSKSARAINMNSFDPLADTTISAEEVLSKNDFILGFSQGGRCASSSTEWFHTSGCHTFPIFELGRYASGLWSHKRINNLDDFNGLKIRAGGKFKQVLLSLGADVVDVNYALGSKLFLQGKLDAFEWLGPAQDITLLQKDLPRAGYFYYDPGVEHSTVLELACKKRVWENLTKNLRDSLDDQIRSSKNVFSQNWESLNKEALRSLPRTWKVLDFSDEITKNLLS